MLVSLVRVGLLVCQKRLNLACFPMGDVETATLFNTMLVVSNTLMLLDHEKTKIKRCKVGIGTYSTTLTHAPQ